MITQQYYPLCRDWAGIGPGHTFLTYFADGGAASTQSPAMLFAGVMFAFFAILEQERLGLLAGFCMSCKLNADAHGSWHPITNIPSDASRDEGHVREAPSRQR